MTTTVVVKANHGWPVDVTTIPVGANGPAGIHPLEGSTARVAAGEERSFYVHSGQDLRIHEVQPDEVAATNAAA
ncbi:hypothetical protein ABEG18_13090 [Alsobacter sp. KACC 23698]|uniref:Uncharacterized protein n=1 Tax=Alsobacter sp. KACC 23698 TaxID=3149229 RepID=A0AAU7J8Y9_9HYPH